MLKVKTKYDYREELIQAIESGKWNQAKNCLGNFDSPNGPHCILGLEMRLFGDKITDTHVRAEIRATGVMEINNDPKKGWPEVVAFIRNLP